MSKFCKYCDNLLSPIFPNDGFAFRCNTCHVTLPIEAEDTLRKERIKKTNVMIYEKILDKAGEDPVNIKAHVDCIKCDNNLVKQIRIGNDMILYNICLKCKTQFTMSSVIKKT